MVNAWHTEALIQLVQQRYPDWDGVTQAAFQADEVQPKRSFAESVQSQLGEAALDALLEEQSFTEIIRRIKAIGRRSGMLYNSVPSRGDLNMVEKLGGISAEFCHQFRRLLYGGDPIDARLRQWIQFAQANALPCKWSFTTFYLFLSDPDQHFFVKPRVSQWLLRFVGQGDSWSRQVNPQTYAMMVQVVQALRQQFANLGVTDLLHIQCIVYIAHRESAGRLDFLPPQAQVDLDQPPTAYEHVPPEPMLGRESSAEYHVVPQIDANSLNPSISIADTAQHLLRDEAVIEAWLKALERKKQLIFFGPPGTGKTFAAQALGRHLVGGTSGFVEQLQLHPNYSYEEFIEGLRPVKVDDQISFEVLPGRFVDVCERAAAVAQSDPAVRCVLILDEINRADLARIFGELLYLLEYRDRPITLASGRTFSVPSNLRLLGTMNSADRSIALVDFALRRRFSFIEMRPNFDLLRRYHAANGLDVSGLIDVLTDLNKLIEPDFQLGSAYFLTSALKSDLPLIWKHEIEPYLQEYFYAQNGAEKQYKWAAIKTKRLID